jgi:Tfp pilus assembly protein PilO
LIDELHKLSLAQKKQFSDLEQDQNNLKTELRKRQHDVEHLQAAAINRIEKVESTVERLEEQDPALKMYSKASKLVEQGAAMNDIIEASGLPRAEVEVLLSLHSRKS